MFFKMIRTQTGDYGTLHAGVIYDASKQPKLIAEAKAYVKSGFAEELTKKQFDQAKAEAPATDAKPDKATEEAAAAKAAEEAAAKSK